MIEIVYKLHFQEGVQTCDYNAIADAITAQYHIMPVELRQPVKIANNCDAGLGVLHILQQRGGIPLS